MIFMTMNKEFPFEILIVLEFGVKDWDRLNFLFVMNKVFLGRSRACEGIRVFDEFERIMRRWKVL